MLQQETGKMLLPEVINKKRIVTNFRFKINLQEKKFLDINSNFYHPS